MGILVRGGLELSVGEETRSMLTGATWRIPSGVPHAADAGPEGAVVVEMWSPPRSDWQELDTWSPRAPTSPTG